MERHHNWHWALDVTPIGCRSTWGKCWATCTASKRAWGRGRSARYVASRLVFFALPDRTLFCARLCGATDFAVAPSAATAGRHLPLCGCKSSGSAGACTHRCGTLFVFLSRVWHSFGYHHDRYSALLTRIVPPQVVSAMNIRTNTRVAVKVIKNKGGWDNHVLD